LREKNVTQSRKGAKEQPNLVYFFKKPLQTLRLCEKKSVTQRRKGAKEQPNLIYFFKPTFTNFAALREKKYHAKAQRRKGTAEFSLFF